MPARRIVRDANEAARDVARALAKTQAFAQSRRDRKKVEMLSRISNAFCGLADCAFAAPAARSLSSRWQPSRKT
jgi:hypothetical protein